MSWRPGSGMETVHAWVVPSVHRCRAEARQLLAEAGGRMLGIDPARVVVGRAAGGQPTVSGPAGTGRAWVSLSYGPGVLAVAASSAGPVGVDIEGPGHPEVVRLAERWFHPDEAAWLRDRPAAGRPMEFLLLWTAKEALGKALGTGLRGDGLRRKVPLPPVADGSFQALPENLWLAHPGLSDALLPDLNGALLPDLSGALLPDLSGALLPDLSGALLPDLNGALLPDPPLVLAIASGVAVSTVRVHPADGPLAAEGIDA